MGALVAALGAAAALRSIRGVEGALGNWRHPDNLSNHWLLVWAAERLRAGEGLLHNTDYYWPIGDAPLLAGNGMEGLSYLPFHLALGWPAGVGAWALAALIWNGLGAYALARAAGAGAGGGWIAAALLAAHPYAVAELDMGHFSQADLGWLLVAMAAWVRCLAAPAGRAQRRWGAAAGALSAVAACLYWYHGVFFAIAAAALGVGAALRDRRLPWQGALAGGLVGGALVAPWALVSFAAFDAVPGVGEPFPHPHTLDAALQIGAPWGIDGAWQSPRALPILCLPLALIGAARAGWGWAAVFALGWLLGLGVEGPLYESLYGLAAPLRRFWWPYRHGVLALAAAAVWIARGADRLPRPRLLGFALALSVPIQLHLTGDLRAVKVSPMKLPPGAWTALAAQPEGVVLEPPLAPAAAMSNTALIGQIWHGMPLLSGHAPWVARVRPGAWDAWIAASPFLSSLQRWERGELRGALPTEDLPALLEAGLRYLAVNPEHFHRRLGPLMEGYRSLGQQLAGEPIILADQIRVYDLARWSPGEEIQLPRHAWPDGLEFAGPEHPLEGRTLPGRMFLGEAIDLSAPKEQVDASPGRRGPPPGARGGPSGGDGPGRRGPPGERPMTPGAGPRAPDGERPAPPPPGE